MSITTSSEELSRVLVVSGGASGIGLAVAERWTAEGGRAVLLDIDEDALQGAVADLEGSRGVVADLRSTDDVVAAIQSIRDDEGRLDAVVNCAGVGHVGSTDGVADEDFERLLDIHLHGALRLSRAAFPMLEDVGGAVVNVSSVVGRRGVPGRVAYSSAKAGLEALTRTAAVEWAPSGVRVNAVAPGFTRTALVQSFVDQGAVDLDALLPRIPQGRLAEPHEVAAPIVFLLGPDAAYVTGQVLVVDGGLTTDGDWYSARR